MGHSSHNEVVNEQPATLEELLALPRQSLGEVDLLCMNLLCASGLPGTESLDLARMSSRLDSIVHKVRVDTDRHLYRVTDPLFADHYRHSETYFRCELLVQTLVEDFGLRYNMDRFWDPDFADSRDQFLHGLLVEGGRGGTCVSIPTLIVAVGQRLGYPIGLALAKEHVFARWDGPGDRGEVMKLNIEASGGGFDSFIDEFYKLGPSRALTPDDLNHREYLVSLTRAEMLAVFLCARGHCCFDNGRYEDALRAYQSAARLAPNFGSTQYFMGMVAAAQAGELEEYLDRHQVNQQEPQTVLSSERKRDLLWNPTASQHERLSEP
jgi:hypothetical protein